MMGPELSDGYVPDGSFDEIFEAGGRVRAHDRCLVQRVDADALPAEELARREGIRDVSARSQGAALTVSGEESGTERTFPMELIPRIVPGDEWAMAEAAQQ